MNNETKKQINERYERELNRGERFWPDSIFKDVIVSLGIFILLIVLATFVGVANEPKADPSDASYVPRPEWYFLFLFKFLALYGQIPVIGKIEWLATVLIPGIAIGILTLLPFIEKSPSRYYAKRVLSICIMAIMVVGIVLLTLISNIPTVSADGSTLSGTLQAISGLVVPTLAIVALILMTFVFKPMNVRLMVWTTVAASVSMIILTGTVLALAPAPAAEEVTVATDLSEQILAGQDLYSVNCVECHGEDGSVAVIEGVEGLEGEKITPINSRDVLYTITDSAMYEVIAYGRPNSGMTPFGKAYGGELSKSDIDYIIIFMRYMWDDRFEPPTLKPLFPALADGEVPSYEIHIQPIVKRYCLSCHRPGKEENSANYLMDTYDNILHSGDNAEKNIIAGDPNSYLLQVIQGTPIMNPEKPDEEMIRTMPIKGHLKPNVIDVFIRWIMNGMPLTSQDAAALFVTPTPAP